MTRTYHPVDDDGQYDRNNARSIPLTMSRSTRDSARSCPISNHTAPISMPRETDNREEKQRRRIAVACQRCRKRKIKCSGDTGNGQGCQNCKNAGTDPAACQFLRVSSSSVNYGDYPHHEWTYNLQSAPCMTSTGPSFIYSTGGNPMPSLSSSSFPGTSRPRYPAPNYPYGASSSSQEYYGSYGLTSQSEGIFEPPYNLQASVSSSYLPSQDHQNPQSTFGAQESLRWHATPTPGRAFNQSYDPELTSSRYPQSSMTFNGSTDAPVSTIDGAPLVPSMGALAISQHPSSMLDGRTLPNPRANSITVSVEGTHGPSYTENLAASQGSRSTASWATGRTAGSIQGSTGTAPSSAAGSSKGSCGRKSSSSSPQDNQELPFAYAPIASSQPSSSHAEVTGSDFGLTTSNTTTNGIDESMIYNPTVSGESRDIMRTPSHRSGTYSYNVGGSSKRGSVSSSESTLLSGQVYQPFNQIRHSSHQHQQQSINEDLRHESNDVTARNTPRTSVARLEAVIR